MKLPEQLTESQPYKKIADYTNSNIGVYFSAFVIFVGLFFALALAVDLLQIHIYRPDSAYYIDDYLIKLESEGRWLNYLLFPLSSHIPGRVAVLSNLLFLFLFVFVVSNRWTGNASYSLLLSLLLIQVAPLMEGLTWPAIPIASFPLLFLAALVSPYINVYVFYLIFGVLLFGTNSFYLLPLTQLYLFKQLHIQKNARRLVFLVVSAWALGFIVGFLFSILMVYVFTGNFGIELEDWRRASPIRSVDDLLTNVMNSLRWFTFYLSEVFSGFWRKFFLVLALLIGFYRVEKNVYIPAVILACGIIVVHFVLILPTGIAISYRTTLAAWIGLLFIFFFYPAIKKPEYYLLLPIVLFMMVSFYRVNHGSIQYYSSITNIYHDELLLSVPLPPERYRGVIFLSSSADVYRTNALLIRKLELKRGKMESINDDIHWVPVAREAGFKTVILCGEKRSSEIVDCGQLNEKYHGTRLANTSTSTLYTIHGENDGYLIVALNQAENIRSKLYPK